MPLDFNEKEMTDLWEQLSPAARERMLKQNPELADLVNKPAGKNITINIETPKAPPQAPPRRGNRGRASAQASAPSEPGRATGAANRAYNWMSARATYPQPERHNKLLGPVGGVVRKLPQKLGEKLLGTHLYPWLASQHSPDKVTPIKQNIESRRNQLKEHDPYKKALDDATKYLMSKSEDSMRPHAHHGGEKHSHKDLGGES